jgi:hypothetical protein
MSKKYVFVLKQIFKATEAKGEGDQELEKRLDQKELT